MRLALGTVADFMKAKVESGSKDEFALIFYNTASAGKTYNHTAKNAQAHHSMLLLASCCTLVRSHRELRHQPASAMLCSKVVL